MDSASTLGIENEKGHCDFVSRGIHGFCDTRGRTTVITVGVVSDFDWGVG
jgi:hypothetical protein